ncbi:NPCBM/NEW2 domain-containing protein [Streptomyces sp. NPDC058861]|uniref:NPCBM/NEW2 domain-containing protein n=1 Tax=Streptomyces sp. NPDC058861 TaxID=3346653 RepID=UPI0036986ADC
MLDRDRERLNPGDGDQQNQLVPPRPPHPPEPPELEPGKGGGNKDPGLRKALATALAFTLVLAGGVAGGIWYTRGHTPEARPVTAGQGNATVGTSRGPSPTPSADTATQDPSPTTLPPSQESTPVTLPPLKTSSFTPPPGRTWSLIRDLAPMNDGSDGYTAGKIRVNTQDYPTGLYADNSASTWQLDRKYTSLVTRLGVSDDASSGSTVEFTIQVDDRVARQITMKPGEDALSVDVELTGAFRLTLSVRSSIGLTVTNGAWIDPVLTG